jgi:hypothetical protein
LKLELWFRGHKVFKSKEENETHKKKKIRGNNYEEQIVVPEPSEI